MFVMLAYVSRTKPKRYCQLPVDDGTVIFRCHFTFAHSLATNTFSESDFTETTAKHRPNKLMLQDDTGVSYKTWNAALTRLMINKSRLVDLLAVYV